ncbi:hypothetical protein Vretimale_11415, partial [Volvox reticuliferus]
MGQWVVEHARVWEVATECGGARLSLAVGAACEWEYVVLRTPSGKLCHAIMRALHFTGRGGVGRAMGMGGWFVPCRTTGVPPGLQGCSAGLALLFRYSRANTEQTTCCNELGWK